MSRVVGYMALHYGLDTLPYAVRGVLPYVDDFYFIHSMTPSHGHATSATPPDHPYELYEAAKAAAGDKFRWYSQLTYQHEGIQRDMIYQLAPDAEYIYVVDADEIWPDGLAADLKAASMQEPDVREWGVSLIHHWRSFYRAVTDDYAAPTRFIARNGTPGLKRVFQGAKRLIHLGYAQDSKYVDYKVTCHGHKGEWRTDVDWLRDKWHANAQTDVHPVNVGYWNPVDVDPWAYMPAYMREHKYAEMGVIP
jgi:hypothetical protein